ncbi:MAG: hypothetical protein Q9195_002439 [Heterodermia aff. obscurata]
MSDPLSIAAGVVGVLTAAAQISTLLIQFTRATNHAPSRARHIITEVNDISGTLSHLQSFLLGNEYSDASRTSLLKADHIVTILSGCVMTFSELEKLLDALETKDMRILDSMKWARKEKDIADLIQRLQNHKSSLSLMLDILNGLVHSRQHQRVVLIGRSDTIVQAKASVDRLHDIVNKCYQEMSTRLHALELKELQRMSYAASVLDDNASIRSRTFVPNIHPSSELNLELASDSGIIAPEFLDELKRSWVYSRNSAFRMSTFSTDRHSTTWSCLSALSLSEVSNISIYDLAITIEEVNNPQRKSQTWSNDQVIPVWPSQSGAWAPNPTMLSELEAIPARVMTSAQEPDNETSSIVTIRGGPEIDAVVEPSDEPNSQAVDADASFGTPAEEVPAYPCHGCHKILEEGKAFELAGNRWHIDCFRCALFIYEIPDTRADPTQNCNLRLWPEPFTPKGTFNASPPLTSKLQ